MSLVLLRLVQQRSAPALLARQSQRASASSASTSNAKPASSAQTQQQTTAAAIAAAVPKTPGMAEFFESQAARDVPFDGRRWSTQELRLKSFEDLHKLWFVLLKERNLLLTHMHYERSQNRAVPSYTRRMQMVKKSMGGIKRVISEREIALNMAKSAHGLAFKRTRIAAAAPERDDEKVRFQPLIEERTRIKAWQVKDKPSMAHLEEATEKTMSHLETIRAALGAHGRKLSLRQALLRGAAIATLQHVTGVPASAPASSPTSDTTTETTSQAPPPSTQP